MVGRLLDVRWEANGSNAHPQRYQRTACRLLRQRNFIVGRYQSSTYTQLNSVWGVGAKDLVVDSNGHVHLASDGGGSTGLYYATSVGIVGFQYADSSADYVTVRLAMGSNGDLFVVGAKKGVGNTAGLLDQHWRFMGSTMTPNTIPQASINQLTSSSTGTLSPLSPRRNGHITEPPSTTYNYSIAPALPLD